MSANQKLSDVSSLLLNTPEAFYWCGFLSADGSISSNLKRLALVLQERDINHMRKFANYIKWKGNIRRHEIKGRGYLTVSAMDANMIPKLVIERHIFNRKTYNPPSDIPSKNADNRFAYSIGFIDGDGCIRKKSKSKRGSFLSVKCHSCWENMLKIIGESLCGFNKVNVKINNNGYARFHITDNMLLRDIKLKAQSLKLPIMHRKWNKIDISFISKRILAKERILKTKEFLDKGINKTTIAHILDVYPSAISQIIKRNGL